MSSNTSDYIRFCKRLIRSCATVLLLSCAGSGAWAQTAEFEINIPASTLENALNALGRQTGVNIIYEGRLPKEIKISALQGTFDLQIALEALLQDSGYDYKILSDKSVAIIGSDTANAREEPVRLDEIRVSTLVTDTEGAVRIDSEILNREQATTLDEVFRSEPGIDALLGPGRQFADLNIRGNEGAGSVIVEIDGAEKNQVRQSHGIDFNPVFLNPDLLESVTVVKGPVSNVYGTGSVGGRVVMRTVAPGDILSPGERMAGRVTFSGETNGPGGSTSLVGAAEVNPDIRVLGGVSYRDFGNYDDANGDEVLNSGSRITGLLGKTEWRATEDLDIGLTLNRNQTAYMGSNVFGRANFRQDSDFKNDVTDDSLSASVNYALSDDLDFEIDTFWSRTESLETLRVNRRGSRANPGDFNKRITTSYGFTGYGNYLRDIATTEHFITAGGSFVNNDLDSRTQTGGTPSETAGERISWGVFVQDQINYRNWLEVIPGIRFEAFDAQTRAGAAVDGHALLPKLTIAVKPFEDGAGRGTQFYTTYARGLRAPRLQEMQMAGTQSRRRRGSTTTTITLANRNLKPEFADTYELGLRYQADDILREGDFLKASAAYYNQQFRDRIEDVTISSRKTGRVTTNTRQTQNIGKAEISGIELKLDYDAGRFFAGGNAAFSEGKNKQTGKALNSVRPANGTAYAGTRFLNNRMTFGTEAEFFSGKTEEGQNQGVVGDSSAGSTLFNLFGSYIPKDGMTVDLRVNNVLNREYRRFDQIDQGQGINGKLTLRLKL